MAAWNELLRQARVRRGLTHQQAAARAGVSAATVYNAESGRKRVSRATLRQLCRALALDLAETNAILTGAGHYPEPSGRLKELLDRRTPLEQLQREIDSYAWPCLALNEHHEILAWNTAATTVAEFNFAAERPLPAQRNLMRIAALSHFRDRVINWTAVVSFWIAIVKANQSDITAPAETSPYFATLVSDLYRDHPDVFPTLVGLWQTVPALPEGGRQSFPVTWRVSDGTELQFDCLITSWSDFDATWALDWFPADGTTWNWLMGRSTPAVAEHGGTSEITALRWWQLLRHARETAGLSRPRLASAAGLSPHTLYRIEHGDLGTSPETLLTLCQAMELDGTLTNTMLTAAGYPPEPSEWALFVAGEPRRTGTKNYQPTTDVHRSRLEMQRAIDAHAWPSLVIDEHCVIRCANAAAQHLPGLVDAARSPLPHRRTLVYAVLSLPFFAQVIDWPAVAQAMLPQLLRTFWERDPEQRRGWLADVLTDIAAENPAALAQLRANWQRSVTAGLTTRVAFEAQWRAPDERLLAFHGVLGLWSPFDRTWALDLHPGDADTWSWLGAPGQSA